MTIIAAFITMRLKRKKPMLPPILLQTISMGSEAMLRRKI
jgi:hypothetical protein